MTQSLYEEKHTSVASSCNENLQGVFTVPANSSTQMNNELQLRNDRYEKTLSAEQVSIYDQYLIIDEVLTQTTILFQEFKI